MIRRLEQAVWVASVLVLAVGVKAWIRAEHHDLALASVSGPLRRVGAAVTIPEQEIDSAAAATADHDPFRLTHEPSDVPYTPDRENLSPPPPPPALPQIALSGIVGPPWTAVLEGVPGHAGSVIVAPGDTITRPPLGVLVMQRVSRDTATVIGSDTTWKLTVRQPWQ